MPSRMERYYKSNEIKRRTSKNQDLYRTIYDEAEYSNVEGISIIEKNEKIDIDMIRELINGSAVKPKKVEQNYAPATAVIEEEEQKSYDIRDILSKAKNERTDKEKKLLNTQYNVLKNINLDNDINVLESVDEDDLKSMIEAISTNSKTSCTGDLLDDLKSIHDPNMKTLINSKTANSEKDEHPLEIDKSFYTSSLGFTDNDFEDFKEMRKDIKTNNILTKILLFILLVVITTGVLFLIYHFTK